MAADDFFSRWGKQKAADHEANTVPPVALTSPDSAGTAASGPSEPAPPPTLDDVAKLTPDSDFSRFVGKDVDESVKRSAMKKLFSNPHFNVMDRLDVYIDDYNQFAPLTPVMLASLNHAKDLLKPLLKQDEKNTIPDNLSADLAASTALQSSSAGDTLSEQEMQAQSGGDEQPAAAQESVPGSSEEKHVPAESGGILAANATNRDKPISEGGQ